MQAKPILISLFLLFVIGLCGDLAAAELSLGDAKAQGLVGEQYDGYLGTVASNPAPAVRTLVNDVNGKRRAKYNRIAQSNDLSLSNVESLAGKKSIQKTASGNYVKAQGGGWQRK